MNHIRLSVCVVVAWCVGALTASAWGPDGHIIVGRIAEQHLTPRTARELNDLLNPGPTNAPITISNSSVVNWADDNPLRPSGNRAVALRGHPF